MKQGNRTVIENKLSEHINKIRAVIDQIEANSKANLQQKYDQQSQKISEVNSQIDEQLDSLCNSNINLEMVENHDDQEIVLMTNILDDERKKVVEFKPDFDINDISIAL